MFQKKLLLLHHHHLLLRICNIVLDQIFGWSRTLNFVDVQNGVPNTFGKEQISWL